MRGVPSTYSGYETFLTTLLPELVDRGHRVTAYCRTGEGLESTPWEGVERKVLPALPGKSVNTLSHGLIAAGVARARRHDVALAVNVANAAYSVIGRVTGQPTVLNTDGQEWDRGKWGNTAKKIFRGSAKIAGRCASGLIADCSAMADIYEREFNAVSTVIPYCAPTLQWEPEPANIDDFGVTPGKYFVIAGRHNPENNIHLVAEAIADSDLPYPLVVLGTANYDSPVTARLEELAARDERILVKGHVGSRAQFLDVLHHAAAYIHGHSVGGINPSIVEAMSASSRVVAFDTAFNREALGDDGSFFSLAPGELAASLKGVLDDSVDDDLKVRRSASDRVAAIYPVSAVVDAYEAVLVAAATHGRRTGLSLPTQWSHP